MISLARRPNKPFEQILVWKYSRFARNREDSILYKAMLKKTGVQVVSINEPFDDTPTGRLLEAIYPFPPASGRAGLTICPECHILPKRC
jgi:site-specific DNA recombinase